MDEEKAPVRSEEMPSAPPMPPLQPEEERQVYRSLFWPIVLVGVGAIWLLINLNVIQPASLNALWRLWPILLILAGIDIIFGRLSRFLGVLLGLATVGLVVVVLIMAPSLGLVDQELPWPFNIPPFPFIETADIKSSQFSESLSGVESAEVTLDLSRWHTEVSALPGGNNLIEADVDYVGRMVFDVSGNRTRRITLREVDAPPFIGWTGTDQYRWDIGLDPDVPLVLSVSGGLGSSTLNLGDLNLESFQYDGGPGSNHTRLPATANRYEAVLETSSGSVSVDIADAAQIDLRLDSGSGAVRIAFGDEVDATLETASSSGSLTIDVPDGAAVRIEVRDDGSGSFNLGRQFEQVEFGDDKTGVWETPGFADADHQIIITIQDAGSGSISIN